MLPNTDHEVRKNLEILNIRGRVGILGRCGRCRCLLQLELVNLALEIVDLILSVCELDLMLLGLNSGVLLYRPQKDTVPK
jgi:hypothetical protein